MSPPPAVRTLADIEAFERERPLSERIPGTVYDLFRRSAAAWPDRPAITFLETGEADEVDSVTTYAGLLRRITQAANLFARLGGAGVGVAYLLPALVETQVCLWAAETAGYAVPLNPFLQAGQIADLVAASGARLLVVCGPAQDPEGWAKALEARRLRPGLQLLALGGGAEGEAVDFEAAAAACADEALAFDPDPDPDRTVACFHTGGTTGAPKLVVHSHRNQLTAALGAASLVGLGPDDVITNGMPLFHVGGAIGISLAPFLAGAEVVMLSAAGLRNPAMVRGYWRIVERRVVTVIAAVPTALAAILAVPLDASLDRVRFGVTGAAATPRAVAERFGAVTGRPLHEILGMTETAGVTAVDPGDAAPAMGSVGFRLPYTELVVRRPTAEGLGEPCAPGEVGVLTVRGPTVSRGYLDAAQNRGVFEAGLLNTGDLAYVGPDGKLRLAGRAKDLIIRSGHNIDPAMIEEAVAAHPAVALAAAVGQPDSYAGELPVCYVALKPQADATPEALMAFARERIAERPAWPKAIHLVPDIPLTAVGKVFKPALRRDAARRVLEAVLAPLLGDSLAAIEVRDGGPRGMTVEVALATSDPQAALAAREALSAFVLDWRISEPGAPG